MNIARFHIAGRSLVQGDVTAVAVNLSPAEESPRLVLTLALVTYGVEQLLIPGTLLDDWGNEVKGRAIYQWIAKQGLSFPRAEIFGLDLNGEEHQQFLREFDLQASLPCYLLPAEGVEGATQIRAILIEGPVLGPTRLDQPPEGLPDAFHRARVQWWRVPFDTPVLSFLDPSIA